MTPDFFYVFNLVLSFSTYSQSFNKICVWEVLGANVLKIPVSMHGYAAANSTIFIDHGKKGGVYLVENAR